MASRLIGATVYGPNNEQVGDVNDLVMERDGRAQALVIGVGGFLGIGEKDVAVPFSAVEFGSGTMASGASGASTTAGGTSATTSSTGGAAGTAAGTGAGMRADGAPDRIVIRMTRDQLNAAPTFSRAGSTAAGDTGAAGSGARTTNPAGGAGAPSTGAGTSTAPKQ